MALLKRGKTKILKNSVEIIARFETIELQEDYLER